MEASNKPKKRTAEFRIEAEEVKGRGKISDITVVMGPNAHVFVSIFAGQYRGTGVLELDGYGSVKCDRGSCERLLNVPLHIYRCDAEGDPLTRELELLGKEPGALLMFDRMFDVMYPNDVIKHAYTVAQLAKAGTRSIIVTHHSFVADVFTHLDVVAEYLQREHIHVDSAINILTDTVVVDDYFLGPYGDVFRQFYAYIYR